MSSAKHLRRHHMPSTALLVNGKNEMVTLLLLRMGIFPAKAQRRQVRNLFLLPLRLGAFAGDIPDFS
jgi:hypothetical protein